jgi:hypothetical protein
VFATTDVNGLPVFLRLADGVVTERRHKNVFRLSHPLKHSADPHEGTPADE